MLLLSQSLNHILAAMGILFMGPDPSILEFYSSSSTWRIPPIGYKDRITYVSDAERDEIIRYISEIYEGSDRARQLLDSAVAMGTRIRIGHAPDPDYPAFNIPDQSGIDQHIGINLSGISKLLMVNELGVVVNSDARLVIAHELFPNIAGFTDLGRDLVIQYLTFPAMTLTDKRLRGRTISPVRWDF